VQRQTLTAVAVLAAALTWAASAPAVLQLSVRVVASYPHDPMAFTQGLIHHCGQFYESTGLAGESSLRRVELLTGRVLEAHVLPAEQFGEGLARVGERLVQLTWKDGIAHQYAVESLEPLGVWTYDGEGWGLCFDGQRLVMSDGGPRLLFRDPDTFEELGRVSVTSDGAPVFRINELECVGDLVYANVWQTEELVVIDPATGDVVAEIDASGLLDDDAAMQADVLNGIAFDRGRNRFFLTGKLWPKVFEVRFVDADGRQPLSVPVADAAAEQDHCAANEAIVDDARAPIGEEAGPAAPTGRQPEKHPGCRCEVASRQRAGGLGVWFALVLLGYWRRRSQYA